MYGLRRPAPVSGPGRPTDLFPRRNVNDLMKGLTGTKITWIFGYTCEIDWLTSTIIDVAILKQLTSLSEGQLRSGAKIIRSFAEAVRRFNGEYLFGEYHGDKISLQESITLVTKPHRQGFVAQDSTADLRAALGWE
jgi:hypothetical protein